MATNDFIPVAPGPGANVLPQAAYVSSQAASTGYQSGVAPSAGVNKSLRQGTIMASVLAQLIVDITGSNAVDDGTTATLLANLKLALSGKLLAIKVFTTSGTYTPTAGAKNILVDCVGAGGGGGGCPSTSASQQSTATGGASGAYGRGYYSAPASAIAVTVGAFGPRGGVGAAGTNGGASGLGSLISCAGGTGGAAGIASTTSALASRAPNDTTLPTGATIISLPGQRNRKAQLVLNTGSSGILGGDGGSSPYGLGGDGGQTSVGGAGVGYGSGGGGCAQSASNGGDVGGNGTSGIVVIYEFG